MNEMELAYAAANLFEGGWRAEDRDQLLIHYKMDEAAVNAICEMLEDMAHDEN